MKILLTGASGLFGINFGLHQSTKHTIIGQTNTRRLQNIPFETIQADLGDFSSLNSLIEKTKPDLLVHAAAMANIDACQREPELANKINASLAGEMANLTARHGIKMVHLSTDAVFDGKRGNYSEEDETNPVNLYAETKLAGEKQVAEANPHALITRVNFYGYSTSGTRSLAELFVNQLASGKGMMGFTDVYFCPFHVLQLADLLMLMVEKDLEGLYHVVSDECLSKYDFGRRIAKKFGFDESRIKPVSWKDAGLVANRSPMLTLDVTKLKNDLGVKLVDQQTCLNSFYALYKKGYAAGLQSMVTA